jgi:hypothetical protein
MRSRESPIVDVSHGLVRLFSMLGTCGGTLNVERAHITRYGTSPVTKIVLEAHYHNFLLGVGLKT